MPTFVHPLYLAALVPLALLPLLMRRGPRPARTLDFAAMALVVGAATARPRRGPRPPPRALLWARLIALALGIMALARPEPPPAPPAAAVPLQALFVLDTSPSMAYVQRGRPLSDWARRAILAEAERGGYPGGVGLICTAPGCRERLPLGATLEALRERLAELPELARGEDLPTTLGRAQRVLGERGLAEQTAVFVVSDGRRESWPDGAPSPPLVHLRRLPIGDAALEGTAWPNCGVSAAELGVVRTGDATELIARLVNWGREPVARAPLFVAVDGHEVLREYVALPAGGTLEQTLAVPLGAAEAHTLQITLRAPGDGFAADDSAYLLAPATTALEVVAINGEPSEVKEEDELYFLAEALRQLPPGERPLRLVQLGRTQLLGALTRQDAPPPDVLVLANVAALSGEERARIAEHVAHGMGLWVTSGGQLDLEHGAGAYEALLGAELRAIEDAAAALGERQARAFSLALGTAPFAPDVQGPEVMRALGATHTQRRVAIAAPPGAGEAALSFDDGAPALWLATRGQGRVALWTTSLDLAWSDVAISSALVPLSQALLRWLGRAEGAAPEPLALGSEITVPQAQLHAARLVGPDHEICAGRPSGHAWRIGPLEHAGVWRGEVQEQADGPFVAAPYLDCAVLADGRESDFAPAPGALAVHGDAVRGDGAVQVAQQGRLQPVFAQLVPLLTLAAVGMLVVEGWLSRRPTLAR